MATTPYSPKPTATRRPAPTGPMPTQPPAPGMPPLGGPMAPPTPNAPPPIPANPADVPTYNQPTYGGGMQTYDDFVNSGLTPPQELWPQPPMSTPEPTTGPQPFYPTEPLTGPLQPTGPGGSPFNGPVGGPVSGPLGYPRRGAPRRPFATAGGDSMAMRRAAMKNLIDGGR